MGPRQAPESQHSFARVPRVTADAVKEEDGNQADGSVANSGA
jgi:hypothetical protein